MSSMEEKRRALQAIGLKKVGVVVCVHSNEATALRVHCILVFRA
jgi:ribosomal protein L30/L7E